MRQKAETSGKTEVETMNSMPNLLMIVLPATKEIPTESYIKSTTTSSVRSSVRSLMKNPMSISSFNARG